MYNNKNTQKKQKNTKKIAKYSILSAFYVHCSHAVICMKHKNCATKAFATFYAASSQCVYLLLASVHSTIFKYQHFVMLICVVKNDPLVP